MKCAGLMRVLLLVLVSTQLVGWRGVGSSESLSKRIPDAYRASATSNYSVAVKGSTKADKGKTGNLDLSWSAPATRTDGEPLSLSEINGYRLYYGKQKGTYIKGANIKDGAAQSVTVTGVPVGTYYVVLTTYDANGIESDYSAAVKKKVRKRSVR